MRLEKTFRNGIIKAVEKGGLEPSECIFDFDGDGGCHITHTPSGSSLLKGGDFSRHAIASVVGEAPPQQAEAFTWAKVEERAERWAWDVKQDVDTPDLWAELQAERELLVGAHYEDVENTPFTPEEQAEIAVQLREIKEHVRTTHSLSEAQMLALDEKLDLVLAATKRVGRKDWRLLFIGSIVSAMVAGVLVPEVVQTILTMGLHGLQHVLDGGGTPPQLPPTP